MERRVAWLLAGFLFSGGINAQWAHRFHAHVTPQEIDSAHTKQSYLYTKVATPLFSQLIFSWNAVRPLKGHFVFFVQARNAFSHRWGTWHRMIEWGAQVQRSHRSVSDGHTKYEHVRLETEPFALSDGFRIKVVAEKGALLRDLKSLHITIVHMKKFTSENTNALQGLPSVVIRKVPKLSQLSLGHPEQGVMCSPTSCSMLTQYVGKKAINPLFFAKKCYDTGLGSYGSWPFNMAHAFEQCGGSVAFFNTRLDSFKELHAQLMRGIPVVVSVRGSMSRAPRPYPHGHLITIIGYDHRTHEVICHDPAKVNSLNVEQRYLLSDFIRAWEASHRLVYWAEPLTRKDLKL